MKRISGIISAAVSLLLVVTLAQGAMIWRFQDVPQDSWFYAPVHECWSRGLMSGTANTAFSPDETMTRGQFVTVLGHLMDISETRTDCGCADVAPTAYYAPYVVWAKENGIVTGVDRTHFAPDDPITREQVAVILNHLFDSLQLDLAEVSAPVPPFADTAKISGYARYHVERLRLCGVMNGDGVNFNPKQNLLRSEGAALLCTLCGILSDHGISVPPVKQEIEGLSPLHVKGTVLADANGDPVQLRGVSTHGLAWFPQYVNRECFRQLHEEMNVNVVRLAMYTAEYGGYCSGGNQTQLKQLIRDGVNYAAEENMYAIVDWHILSDSNPNTHVTEAKAFFKEMTAEFADYDNVIYEICNEPNGSTSWSEIKRYAEAVIPVIRAEAPDAVILVGTPTWSQNVDQAAADPIQGYDNLMYTLHFYSGTHKDSLRSTMVSALNKGLPVFVSEFGICDASGNGSLNLPEADKWVDLMDRWGVSYCMWNLSNKAESSSMIASGCAKTGGFSYSDLSPTGQWFLGMMTGEHALPEHDGQSSSPAQDGTSSSGSTVTTGSIRLTVTPVNQWESEGRSFCQYDITATNVGASSCTVWSASIDFSSAVTPAQSWNGSVSADGSRLTIRSVDYNGSLAPGESVGNIGIIVSSAGGLSIK